MNFLNQEFQILFSLKNKFLEFYKINIGEEYVPSKTVFIIQDEFYRKDGSTCFEGGSERYCLDLSKIIKNLNYNCVLLQQSTLDNLWHKNYKGLDIIGLNKHLLFNLKKSGIISPKLTILSGPPNRRNIIFDNNLFISHGIYWDNIEAEFKIKNIKRHKKYLSKINTIVSVDANFINWARATFNNVLSGKNINFIPNYVDQNLFYPVESKPSDKLRIVFPRRLESPRGFYILAEIAPELLEKYKNIEIDFIGTIRDEHVENTYNQLKNKYPQQINLQQYGPYEMNKAYENADIILIPTTYSEGTSLSCIEAMACKKPIISTYVGGLSNLIIDNYNGLLIKPDATSLKCAIEELIEDPELRNNLSEKAYEISKTFSKSYWDKRWTDILKEILK